jgi:hypothetical protein
MTELTTVPELRVRIYQGETWRLRVRFGPDGPSSLSGYGVFLDIRERPGASSAITRLKVGSGVTLVSNPGGFDAVMNPSTTRGLQAGNYRQDCFLVTPQGEHIPLWQGPAIVTPRVTRAEV